MATLTLNHKSTAKNGMNVYKADNQRSTGSVYLDKKMFPNGAPATITIEAEGIQVPVAPVKAAKADKAPAAGEVTDAASDAAGA